MTPDHDLLHEMNRRETDLKFEFAQKSLEQHGQSCDARYHALDKRTLRIEIILWSEVTALIAFLAYVAVNFRVVPVAA